jgi:hypothetical protein
MALLVCPRSDSGIDDADEESIDEAAKLKQVLWCADQLKAMGKGSSGLEVGPCGGNQRLASVRQDQHEL